MASSRDRSVTPPEESPAKHSPTKRAIKDVAERFARLEEYERWREPTKIDFEADLGHEAWNAYWAMWDSINVEMCKCQDFVNKLRDQVMQALQR